MSPSNFDIPFLFSFRSGIQNIYSNFVPIFKCIYIKLCQFVRHEYVAGHLIFYTVKNCNWKLIPVLFMISR